MIMHFFLTLALAFLPAPRAAESPAAVLATFNVEWLSDTPGEGAVRRSPDDYRNLARAVTLTGASLLCLQEVENDGALARIEPLLAGRFRHRMEDTRDRQDQ